MSKTYYVEAERAAATALLCEGCQTYFVGADAEEHFKETGHVVTWLRDETA